MRAILTRGLTGTAALWPEVRLAYGWVHRAAHLLANEAGQSAEQVRQVYAALLADLAAGRGAAGVVAPAVDHFLKVTASYWPGLFACYTVPDLPRTNNDLEHCFGSARYHQRRATGRKAAEPSLVIRGSVRVVAALATQAHRFQASDLRPLDRQRWRQLRCTLDARHATRRAQLRFRRDPAAYLARLEDLLLKPGLPP